MNDPRLFVARTHPWLEGTVQQNVMIQALLQTVSAPSPAPTAQHTHIQEGRLSTCTGFSSASPGCWTVAKKH